MRTIGSFEEVSSGSSYRDIRIRVCVKISGQIRLKLNQMTSSIDQSIRIWAKTIVYC